MDVPLISIITITFNAEQEIRPTLKSIYSQSFNGYEHIVVDGASSDHTIEIVRNLGGTAPRILSEKDNGLYDAMNKGLRMAKGKYVLFLNAGDSFADDSVLRKYADATKSDPDIIYSDTVIVDDNRNVLRPRHLGAPDKLTFDSFADGMLVCHQAFMVKRRLAPLYNLDYRFSADYDWTIRCIKYAREESFVNLHMVGIHYLDAGMTEKNKIASLKERFMIMQNHYGVVRTVGKHLAFIPRAVGRKLGKKD